MQGTTRSEQVRRRNKRMREPTREDLGGVHREDKREETKAVTEEACMQEAMVPLLQLMLVKLLLVDITPSYMQVCSR